MYADVYVPNPGTALAAFVLPGSGMVGTIEDDNRITVDFAGPKFQYENVRNYADQVDQAWGRHSTRYPTIARRTVDLSDVTLIGDFDTTFGRVTIYNEDLLARWIGHAPSDEDLLATGHYEDLRTVATWPREMREQIKHMPASVRRKYEQAGLI